MLPAERRQRIAEIVRRQGQVAVSELAQQFAVSVMTIRRDLAELESRGVIDRTHGGAIIQRPAAFEPRYVDKAKANQEAKARIGEAAAALVRDGDTIILDSGSTTMEIARRLKNFRNLTVVTNDLLVGMELMEVPTLQVIITGGLVRQGFYSLVGLHAEAVLRETNANKLFLGADAVDLGRGVTNANWEEVAIKRLMIEAAQQAILAADHTKFGQAALAFVTDLGSLDGIITDDGMPEELALQIRGLGPWVQRV